LCAHVEKTDIAVAWHFATLRDAEWQYGTGFQGTFMLCVLMFFSCGECMLSYHPSLYTAITQAHAKARRKLHVAHGSTET
jgi:hypothetical protein